MRTGIGDGRPAHTVSEIKEAVLWHRAISTKCYARDPYAYRVDRFESDYLSPRSKWRAKVSRYLGELKASGEHVVYADICGRTTGTNLGADVSYSFSLHVLTEARLMRPKGDVLIEGDLFRMRDFYSFLARMRSKGDRPAFVTFCPVAGLQGYTPFEKNTPIHSAVTWQRLENNLKRLLEVVRPRGYVYLETPFPLSDVDLGDWLGKKEIRDYTSVKWMKAFCRGKRCTVEFERSICGTNFLLRKWKERERKA